MATTPTASIDVPVRIVLAESDDDAARQREMADHVRGVGQAWLELADSLEAFADYLDTLPVAVTDDPPDPPP